jgi:hypothetical protein
MAFGLSARERARFDLAIQSAKLIADCRGTVAAYQAERANVLEVILLEECDLARRVLALRDV